MLYRGATAIFTEVFNKSDDLTRTRWIQFQIGWHVPETVTEQAFQAVIQFATNEIDMLVFSETRNGNKLPLTDNQRQRQQQMRENDKKRVAQLNLAKGGGKGVDLSLIHI